ncbi:response regulator [Marinifilum sp. JC120]|nr:response regulator [Marinifilum sp. JC120]
MLLQSLQKNSVLCLVNSISLAGVQRLSNLYLNVSRRREKMDKARILVVDDTPANLDILSELLSPKYRVYAAINGEDALRMALSDAPPDLVLLDIMMPGIDGYQVCTMMKADERTRQIPIIFVTAMDEIENEEKGLNLGAVDYITKPFTPSIVMARVKTHLSLYNQTRLLQNLISERTIELEKAKDEAESANRAKSSFLANMSHELRTPLNAIMGMAQLLLGSPFSKDQKEFLEDTLKSSSRMLTMVNDLLELSRVEAERILLCPSQFKIRESIDQVLYLYRDQANQKGLTFTSSFEATIPDFLYADIGRIRQVFMNLLNNALRFTNSGFIDVAVKFWGENEAMLSEPATVIFCFSVKDSGIGISEEKLTYIFEPFSIGENFMTKVYSGAGLGLSISKHLVELMGGHIWLESQEGVGTTVNFTVPCRLCTVDEED